MLHLNHTQCILPGEWILSVQPIPKSKARDGDTVFVVSPRVSLEVDSCLRLDTRMRGGLFDVSVRMYQVQYLKTYVCTVEDQLGETWRTAYIDVPAQDPSFLYEMVFTVVFLEPKEMLPYVEFDNMTLYSDVCENVIPQGL